VFPKSLGNHPVIDPITMEIQVASIYPTAG